MQLIIFYLFKLFKYVSFLYKIVSELQALSGQFQTCFRWGVVWLNYTCYNSIIPISSNTRIDERFTCCHAKLSRKYSITAKSVRTQALDQQSFSHLALPCLVMVHPYERRRDSQFSHILENMITFHPCSSLTDNFKIMTKKQFFF